MRAMVLVKAGTPLQRLEVTTPSPGSGQVLVKAAACDVCRTDLHVVDGEQTEPKLPIIPAHEIVDRIEALGGAARADAPDRTWGSPLMSDETVCHPLQ